MDGKSLSEKEIKINDLKQLFPEAFEEGKVDFEKLKLILGENITLENERYVLNWAGKTDAFHILQEPTTKTLIPNKEESVDFENTENIFIEGENLDVLKVLQKSYFGKIKMIYIDPPYNTGNDSFIYPDKFSESKKEYLQRVGDLDEDGNKIKEGLFHENSKENGQYHSNWLNMMMPRLFLARNLLRDDGVIFVSIDDNEVHNLRLLMNEIFGEENFIGEFVWQRKTQPSFLSKEIAVVTEYLLAYKKNTNIIKLKGGYADIDKQNELINIGNALVERTLKKEAVEINNGRFTGELKKGFYGNNGVLKIELLSDVKVEKGKPLTDIKIKGRITRTQETIDENISKGAKIFIKSLKTLRPTIQIPKNSPAIKPPLSLLSKKINNIIPTNTDASDEIKSLFNDINIMNYPKPTKLIKYIIESVTYATKDSIILDFFAGSGTTGHAVYDLNSEDGGNRKFILVQIPEECGENSEAKKAGYDTIAEVCKERLRRAGKKVKEEIDEENKKNKEKLDLGDKEAEKKIDLGFKVMKLQESNFKQWQQVENEEELKQQLEMFVEPLKEDIKIENIVYELLLKNGKSLNSKIEKEKGFYVINDNEIIMMLEGKADEKLIEKIIERKPEIVIALDSLFAGNDQLKTNTALQMKDNEIKFETI